MRRRFGPPARMVIRVAALAALVGWTITIPTNAGANVSTLTGNDISFPQCGTTFPSHPAFGIVGINKGLANALNPCLGPSSSYPAYGQSELYWAVASSVGGTSQPKASVYVNTADPGNLYNGAPLADWPTSSSSADPYGQCTTTTVSTKNGTATVGQNSTACAWQYGNDRASQDVLWLKNAAQTIDAQSPPVTVSSSPAAYPWWLDVETTNTWQSGSSGDAMNVADLQGMIAGLRGAGVGSVGGYSTSYQWDQITGGTTASSGTLSGIPNWIPGARKPSAAEANCSQTSFTGGKVLITQWSGHPDDNDYAC